MIPKKLEGKKYYKSGEVADAFGLEKPTLYYWEENFEILCPKRTTKGDRRYVATDIKNIALIKELVHNQKLSVKGANKKLNQKTFDKFDLKTRLLKIREVLKGIEQNL